MKHDQYRVDVVQRVLERLGYSEWMAKNGMLIFTHTVSKNEIIIDTSYPVLLASLMKRKMNDLELSEIYFDSLFDAEITLMTNSNKD